MTNILDRDATAQLAALAAGEVSSVELLDAALARRAATHDRLNAVVATDIERARAQAQADARRVCGGAGDRDDGPGDRLGHRRIAARAR